MTQQESGILSLSTDDLVKKLSSGGSIIREIVDEIAARRDCTIYHLLDLAESPTVTDELGSPKDSTADLWQEGAAIETKFRALLFKEQIAATRYVLEHYSKGSGNIDGALGWFFIWMNPPDPSQCNDLAQIVEDDVLSIEGGAAFIDAFEFLAGKDGLLK
jgi:hypothetical protein